MSARPSIEDGSGDAMYRRETGPGEPIDVTFDVSSDTLSAGR
jgi:hypothetical protein